MEVVPMNSQKSQTDKEARPAAVMEAEPMVDPALAERADRILTSSTKANAELDVVGAEFATDPDLRNSPAFNFKRKLILAEVLRLLADSLDAEQKDNLKLANLRKGQEALKQAVALGIGQMLMRIRPREVLANQIILWKANSQHAKARMLPKNQTSALIGPNMLARRSFQKVVDHELKSTNLHIAKGEYRSFMFVPFTAVKGESKGLLPYMNMAARYHMLVVGSLPINDTLDASGDVFRRWKFSINDVPEEDFETLSHATILLNNLIVRDAHSRYYEREPLAAGLEFAFAAQMTKYFQRKKVGQWYIPVIHPKIKAKDMRTVNEVDKLDSWRKAVENQFNFAYTTTEDQDHLEPGVRIYGATTVFPEAAVDIEALGSQAVPLIQAQARAVKNRIYDQLQSILEKLIGGQYEEDEVKKKVRDYLDNMYLKKQIHGFEVLEVSKSDTGTFRIKVEIRWSAAAEQFIIDATGRSEEVKDN
jgi:hypothetical protein